MKETEYRPHRLKLANMLGYTGFFITWTISSITHQRLFHLFSLWSSENSSLQSFLSPIPSFPDFHGRDNVLAVTSVIRLSAPFSNTVSRFVPPRLKGWKYVQNSNGCVVNTYARQYVPLSGDVFLFFFLMWKLNEGGRRDSLTELDSLQRIKWVFKAMYIICVVNINLKCKFLTTCTLLLLITTINRHFVIPHYDTCIYGSGFHRRQCSLPVWPLEGNITPEVRHYGAAEKCPQLQRQRAKWRVNMT